MALLQSPFRFEFKAQPREIHGQVLANIAYEDVSNIASTSLISNRLTAPCVVGFN